MNIVATFPKVTYKFIKSPIKILVIFFTEIEKITPKFLQKHERQPKHKTNLNVKGATLNASA